MQAINQVTVQNLLLLQQNTPFEKIYGFELSLTNYQKANGAERGAFVHFLLYTLDRQRTLNAFEPSVKLCPFQITNLELFKQVAYMQIQEAKNSAFEMPPKAEFLAHTPKNHKMLFHFSQQVLEIVFCRLARQYNVAMELETQFSQKVADSVNNQIINNLFNSMNDFNLLQQEAKVIQSKIGGYEREIKELEEHLSTVEEHDLTVDNKVTELTGQIARYTKQLDGIRVYELNGDADEGTAPHDEINHTELRYLSGNSGSSAINLRETLTGLHEMFQRNADVLASTPDTVPAFNDLVEKMSEIITTLERRLKVLGEEIAAIRTKQEGYSDRVRFWRPQEGQNSGILEFSLLSVEECKEALKKAGKLLSESRVAAGTGLERGEDESMRRTDLDSSMIEENLASRLRKALNGGATLAGLASTIFRGTDVEGVRSYMEMIQ